MFKPMGNKVAIKPNEEETKTSSGLYIPENESDTLKFGVVEAVGNGQYQNGELVPMTVKIGDTVAFPKYSLTEIRYDDQKYYVVDENQIVAIMKEAE